MGRYIFWLLVRFFKIWKPQAAENSKEMEGLFKINDFPEVLEICESFINKYKEESEGGNKRDLNEDGDNYEFDDDDVDNDTSLRYAMSTKVNYFLCDNTKDSKSEAINV